MKQVRPEIDWTVVLKGQLQLLETDPIRFSNLNAGIYLKRNHLISWSPDKCFHQIVKEITRMKYNNKYT